MSQVRIVTDSTAHFQDPEFLKKHGVTVVPLTIHFGKEYFREGVDLDTVTYFRRVSNGGPLASAASPTTETFAALYESISQSGDEILSIHLSSKLSRTWQNAKAAADALLGRCQVAVIDTLTTSVGLGILVEAAVAAAERGEALDDIVRLVRGMIPRLYVVFFVESLDYLEHSKRLGKAQSRLGTMLGIKPFLTIEEGDIVPMEKVRTRQQAIEKLMEFIGEFAVIERLAILHGATNHSDETRQLLERLALDFPGRKWDITTYGPSLATQIGPDSLGVIVFEGLEDDD
ncbi:MAG: DegV family protein [Chloroflexi bacterium]|nr:DegV family protein [Chloroflexota bacterium]